MSFFQSKREAVLCASSAILLANIPIVNFGVALAAAMADDAGKMDGFEKCLQGFVIVSSLLYFPATVFFLPALFCLAISALSIYAEECLTKQPRV